MEWLRMVNFGSGFGTHTLPHNDMVGIKNKNNKTKTQPSTHIMSSLIIDPGPNVLYALKTLSFDIETKKGDIKAGKGNKSCTHQ